MGGGDFFHCPVGFGQGAFFFFDSGDAVVAIVGWVSDDDEDVGLAFYFVGGVAFVGEFLEEELVFGMGGGNPAGEGVGEEDSGALVL